MSYAITLIYEQCLGYRKKPNGFWEKETAGETSVSRLRPRAQSEATTVRRAIQARERNRPLGRPRGPSGIG